MKAFESLQVETQTHVQVLMHGMLALEQKPAALDQLETCVQAARSLTSAARIAGLHASADLARAVEDCLSAAQRGDVNLYVEQIELMFRAIALFDHFAKDRHDRIAAVEPSMVSPQDTGYSRERDTLARMKRVLVIDDSLAVRELARSLLSRRGYDVEVAVDGVDGWNAIRAGAFDLVLADADMPLVDGFKLAQLIRKERRLQALPVAILIDDDSAQSRRLAFEADADYYVVKSKLREHLVKTVASLIGAAEV